MSEIKVDTLTGKTTANDITVTVGATATMSLEQGLTKAWVTYTDVSWTIGDSLNCSSATDVATADFATNFSSNFGSINIVSAGISTYGTYFSYYDASANSHTTSAVNYYVLTGGGAATDPNFSYASSVGFNYHGDLA